MSTSASTPIEYNVVRFDADSTDEDLIKGLAPVGKDGWKLSNTVHLHHLNTIVFVFFRETGSSTK
ncbi:hypothetical protein OAG63_00865 [Methylacidiphilales bacterium]|nr:hypothetical protein [Candidatus Methylacidiphilales bacterium]